MTGKAANFSPWTGKICRFFVEIAENHVLKWSENLKNKGKRGTLKCGMKIACYFYVVR